MKEIFYSRLMVVSAEASRRGCRQVRNDPLFERQEKERLLYLSEKILLEQSYSNYFLYPSPSVDHLSKNAGDTYAVHHTFVFKSVLFVIVLLSCRAG